MSKQAPPSGLTRSSGLTTQIIKSLIISAAFEIGRAFFHESLHSFLLVFGGEEEVEVFSFEVQPFFEGGIESFEYGFFGHFDGDGTHGGYFCGEFDGFAEEEFRGHDAVDEAGFMRFVGGDEAAGEHHFHGEGFTNGAGEALGAAGARDDPEFYFRLTEAGGFAGNDHIAEHREFAAAAEGEPADCGDDRFLDFFDGIPGAELVDIIHIDGGFTGHLFDIGAGGESFFVAGEDDGADLVVRIEGFQRVPEFAHQFEVKGVQLFGPVQLDVGHKGGHLMVYDNELRLHS